MNIKLNLIDMSRVLGTLILIIGICYHVTCFSYESKSGYVTATLSSYVYQTDFTPPSGLDNPVLAGNSLIVNGDLNHHGSLELGLFYGHYLSYRKDEMGSILIEKLKRLRFTMGYKWWLADPFALSLTYFSAYAVGDPSIEYVLIQPGGEIPYTSAQDTVRYGFDLALQADLWEKNRWAIVSEARYTYSLKPRAGERSNVYGISIGVRYLAQNTTSEKLK